MEISKDLEDNYITNNSEIITERNKTIDKRFASVRISCYFIAI